MGAGLEECLHDKKTYEIWRVQLFSSSHKETVEKTWQTILKKHKGLLSDTPMTIEKADIAGKGTFYRLKVGEFSTKQRATTLCTKLKKQKRILNDFDLYFDNVGYPIVIMHYFA